MLTIDILGLQRARRISGRNKLPPLPSDFTWMVGNKDTLTTSDHDMFEVCSNQLLIYTRIYIYVFIFDLLILYLGAHHRFIPAHCVSRRALLCVRLQGNWESGGGRMHKSVGTQSDGTIRTMCDLVLLIISLEKQFFNN